MTILKFICSAAVAALIAGPALADPIEITDDTGRTITEVELSN